MTVNKQVIIMMMMITAIDVDNDNDTTRNVSYMHEEQRLVQLDLQ